MDFRAQLKRLASIREPGRTVVTLALDVSRAGIPKPTRVFLKDEVYPRLRADGLKATSDRIRAHLDALDPAVDGLFLVAGEGVWQVLELAAPLRNRVYVDRRPYLAPLFEHAARGERSAVVVVNGREVILREVHAGRAASVGLVRRERLESDPEKAYNNVRQTRGRLNARRGVQGGAERDLHDRAVEETFRSMMREAARRLAQHHRTSPLERVYFTGSPEHVEIFRQRLPRPLRERLRAVDHAARVPEEAARAYDEETARRAEEFRSLRSGGVRTAAGPQEVLDRLAAGEIERVFVNPDDPLPGRVCLRCGARFALVRARCPFCEGELEERSLTQEVLTHALAHPPLDVRFVREAWIENVGGIAAVLRARRKKTG